MALKNLERFFSDLRDGRYSEAMVGVAEVKDEFNEALKRLNANMGWPTYDILRSAINMAEDGKLQKLMKLKAEATSEFEILKKQYQKKEEADAPYIEKVNKMKPKPLPPIEPHSMRYLEKFITELKEGRYPNTMHNIEEAKQEFLYIVKEMNATMGWPNYELLRGAINMAEDGNLNKLMKCKDETVGEFELLKNEYKKYIEAEQARRRQANDDDFTEAPNKNSTSAIRRKLELEIANVRKRIGKDFGDTFDDDLSTIPEMIEPMTPSRVADMFSDLYDNEYFDAYQDLLKSNQLEEKIVRKLNRILKNAYEFALAASEEQLSWLMICLTNPKEGSSMFHIPGEIQDDLRASATNVQRECGRFALQSLSKDFMIKYRGFKTEELANYALKCLEVSWFCSVQQPKLYMEWEDQGDPLSDHLTTYTRSGKVVDYQVWPTLYMYVDGPVLVRGIVQPY